MPISDDLQILDPCNHRGMEGKVVITCGRNLVLGGDGFLWDSGILEVLALPGDSRPHFLGHYNGEQVFAVALSEADRSPPGARLAGLREYLGQVPEGLFKLLGRALQINDWYAGHSYCGYCGEPTALVPNERATACDGCGKIFYPRLSPCIMALIHRGDQCVLARNAQWRKPYYSILAGFIEPGESAEEAVHREVMEEVGLRVHNLNYFGSQPWPFPGQLMLGFFAEYSGGEICVDGVEIAEANWYNHNDLPNIPGPSSLSGQLIKAFVERCRARE